MTGKRRRPTAVTHRSHLERGDSTRNKLLLSSIDVFGRQGFEGATTRTLAKAAGVNLQAIPYYFGGKEKLYIAAAEFIGSSIAEQVQRPRERIRSRLAEADRQGPPIEPGEARALLTGLLQTMAELFVSDRSQAWARFLIREQMQPTEAFRRVYGGVMKPLLEAVRRLVAILLDEAPTSEHVALRTLSLLGSVMVFRVAHAAAMAQLSWKTIGPREIDVIRVLAGELVASLDRSGRHR